MKKRIGICSLLVSCSLVWIQGVSSANQNVSIQVGSQLVTFPDVQPYVDDESGRTMVPVRFVTETLGADVTWDDHLQAAFLSAGDTTITLLVGKSNANIRNRNDNTNTLVKLDAPAAMVGGRVMVPMRFIVESFGKQIAWDAKKNTVILSDKNKDITLKDNSSQSSDDSSVQSSLDTAMSDLQKQLLVFIDTLEFAYKHRPNIIDLYMSQKYTDDRAAIQTFLSQYPDLAVVLTKYDQSISSITKAIKSKNPSNYSQATSDFQEANAAILDFLKNHAAVAPGEGINGTSRQQEPSSGDLPDGNLTHISPPVLLVPLAQGEQPHDFKLTYSEIQMTIDLYAALKESARNTVLIYQSSDNLKANFDELKSIQNTLEYDLSGRISNSTNQDIKEMLFLKDSLLQAENHLIHNKNDQSFQDLRVAWKNVRLEADRIFGSLYEPDGMQAQEQSLEN